MPFFRRKQKPAESDTKSASHPSSKQLQAPPVSGQQVESLSNRSGKLGEPYQAHLDSGYASTNTSPTPSEHDDSHPCSKRTRTVKTEPLLTALPPVPVSSIHAPDLGPHNAFQHGKQLSIQLHRPVVDNPIDLPRLSTLEGFKVNKRRTVLDEEGDVIGELVKGDLLDCVRQKVNGRGEVLDDQGHVVGQVRTLQKSPVSATSTPVLPPVISDAPLVRTSDEHSFQHVRSLSKSNLDVVQSRPGPKGEWSPDILPYRGDITHRDVPSRSTSHLSFTGLSPMQGMPRPPMNSRHTFTPSTSRSPYSSMDPSAYGSEDGRPASPRPGGYTYKSDFTQAMISDPSSVASSTYRQHRPLSQSPATFATTATINRPRTYFTHQGKITVQPGEEFLKPARKESEPKVDTPTPTAEKRKSRLFGLGKKK